MEGRRYSFHQREKTGLSDNIFNSLHHFFLWDQTLSMLSSKKNRPAEKAIPQLQIAMFLTQNFSSQASLT